MTVATIANANVHTEATGAATRQEIVSSGAISRL